MKPSMLLVVLVSLATFPMGTQGQIKLPVYPENKENAQNVIFEEATKHGDFRHGSLVRITLNNASSTSITGTLVRVDPKHGQLYVRTAPGRLPRAFSESEIKRVDKGVIQHVSSKDRVLTPEIQTLVIYNGPNRVVTYSGPTLSSDEQARLQDLERAENEMTRLEYLRRLENQTLAANAAIVSGEQRTQELINDLLRKQESPTAASNTTFPYSTYPYLPNFLVLQDQWPNAPIFGALNSGITRLNNSMVPKVSVGTDVLTKARQDLMQARRHAVFENGSLVAVIPPEQDK